VDLAIATPMLKQMFLNPEMDFESILTTLNFKKNTKEEIISRINLLQSKFSPIRKDTNPNDKVNFIMGELRAVSEGNINLSDLAKEIK